MKAFLTWVQDNQNFPNSLLTAGMGHPQHFSELLSA